VPVQPLQEANRRRLDEDMFISPATLSVFRGRRRAPRTRVLRPCWVWAVSEPRTKLEGVAMDLNRYGIAVRMLSPLPVGTKVCVQLMRDENFTVPLSSPLPGRVVRHAVRYVGFVDHGIMFEFPSLTEARPVRISVPTRPTLSSVVQRMHTADRRGTRRYRG
jgi:hypothetical protein